MIVVPIDESELLAAYIMKAVMETNLLDVMETPCGEIEVVWNKSAFEQLSAIIRDVLDD